MKHAVVFTGWIVAAAAIAIALGLNAQVRRLENEVERLQSSLQSREEQVAKLAALSKESAESTDETQGQAEAAGLDSVEETPVVEPAPPVPDEAVEAEDTSGASPGAEPTETGAHPEADEAAQEQEKARQEKVVNAQLDMMMGMAYAKLFAELNLPAGVENQVRNLLVKRASETRGAAVAAMQEGKTPAKDVKRKDDEAKVRLREELSHVLNAQELAAWDSYDEYADQYLYQNLLDGQLSMLAPGLSSEGRQVTKDVFAEELVSHLDAFAASDTLYTLANFNAAQSAALHEGLTRLTETLDVEQYAHAEAFVQQCDAMFNAMAE